MVTSLKQMIQIIVLKFRNRITYGKVKAFRESLSKVYLCAEINKDVFLKYWAKNLMVEIQSIQINGPITSKVIAKSLLQIMGTTRKRIAPYSLHTKCWVLCQIKVWRLFDLKMLMKIKLALLLDTKIWATKLVNKLKSI